jgi:formyl-CoA transferase
MAKPLEGIRVLDLTQYLAGPQATLFLAGLGAEVIRINNPGAKDPVADSPPYAGPKGVSFQKQTDDDIGIAYLKRARNKKSITLNIKDPRGRELFMRLVESSDVLVENFGPGVTKRLGIDYPSLKERRADLVYCAISSYGATGPDSDMKGYDAVVQAAAGLMNLTGFPDGPPIKAGSALGDSLGGTFAFGGIMTALFHRERTGEGQFIDISMADCLFSLIFDEPMDCYEELGLPERMGNRIMRLSPFNSYPAKDGWLIIATGTDIHWRDLLKAIGRGDLIGDPRYADMTGRLENNEEIDEIIAAWTKERETAEAVSRLRKGGVICGPVRNIRDILAWPHLRERGMIGELPHPRLGTVPGVHAQGFPFKLEKSPGGYERPAPLIGEHNAEILGGLLGIDLAELEQLKKGGIL